MSLLGVLYIIIGIGLFLGKRLFYYLGVVIPLIWASMGIYYFLAVKPELIILPFVANEAVVILCCCSLIIHKTS